MQVPFNSLKPNNPALDEGIQEAILRVVRSGWYILGPEVEAFEAEFARYHDVSSAVSVANGTDAIELALRGLKIGAGDEVITVAHTAVATVCAIERAGAIPVLVDIDPETYTMNPAAAEAAITPRTRAILPVHLYGQPADMNALLAIAERHNLILIEDCAQAHGAEFEGRKAGTMGYISTFSFYPTKNLGAYGDGGAIITNDTELAARIRRLRFYGQETRYNAVERGMNSRLDEMQAALLRVKLQYLDEQNRQRQHIAAQYDALLKNTPLVTPLVRPDRTHIYHLYVVRHLERDRLMAQLKEQGIGTQIHYPIPVHRQQAYHDLGYGAGSLPVTETIASEILSLPMYPGLTDEAVEYVASALTTSLERVQND